jgi:hypothetical protein
MPGSHVFTAFALGAVIAGARQAVPAGQEIAIPDGAPTAPAGATDDDPGR